MESLDQILARKRANKEEFKIYKVKRMKDTSSSNEIHELDQIKDQYFQVVTQDLEINGE